MSPATLALALALAAAPAPSPLGPILSLPPRDALPPPLPAPDALLGADGGAAEDGGEGSAVEAPLPAPDDPLEFLYAHRINFAAEGAPLVTVRLMEGQDEVQLSGETPLSIALRGAGEKRVGVPAGVSIRLRVVRSKPARLRFFAQVADLSYRDRAGVSAARALWERRGEVVTARTLGTVYGIAGRVLDNRRTLLLLGEGGDRGDAQGRLDALRRRYGIAGSLHEELIDRPQGEVEIADGSSGGVVAASSEVAVIEAEGQGAIDVRGVEFGMGYAFHGRADRRYRGRLFAAVDRDGKLAIVEALPLEELLRGLVPSEIFSSSPPEALRAQAVTARGEVLAKIGARHLTDPYLLCAEQHCQVYSGLGGERKTTDDAVLATRGEALFSRAGLLVDSVYSAVCGGHTEDNEVVWGGPPDPSLRGVTDLLEGSLARGPGRSEASVRRWIASEPAAFCHLPDRSGPARYRWSRRFGAAELDGLLAGLAVGRLRALVPRDRGVSGRAATLEVVGERGTAEVHGELVIRKLLQNLASSAFVVDVEPGPDGHPAAFTLRGAGWGHGVGMCQTGAIGRAQRGQSYREILRHYFNGAEIARVY